MPKLEAIPSAPGRMGGRRARASRVSSSLAEINVVPLVDVMLVLLVIFMVTAPMMKQGFAVQLPKANHAPSISGPVTVTVPSSFHRDRRLQIDGTWVSLASLDEQIKYALESHSEKSVIIAGDASVSFGDVMPIFAQLMTGGITSVSIQTQPAGAETLGR